METAQGLGVAGNVSAAAQSSTRTPLIDAANVEKSYGATRVLRGVSFQVRAGEIHALLGGNGAGKSTLIRIITGLTSRDAGEVAFTSAKLGRGGPIIAVVHQELALLPKLSVAENIGIVHAKSGLSQSSRRRMRDIALNALRLIDAAVGEEIVDLPAAKLSLHEGQIVEIARALSTGAEVLLLDEPTANLTAGETAKLFSVLKRLARDEGIGIVFVSHRMREIRELCDVCTILRDGTTVANGTPLASLSDAEIIQQMGQSTHRSGAQLKRRERSREGTPVELLGPDGAILEIWPGTILGLAGAPAGPTGLIDPLVGAGKGAGWRLSGEGLADGFPSPAAAARAGIG
ncbi:MAG: sugar ABC transporter ATP-binding protein, partial [Mesorhizobium sp.]